MHHGRGSHFVAYILLFLACLALFGRRGRHGKAGHLAGADTHGADRAIWYPVNARKGMRMRSSHPAKRPNAKRGGLPDKQNFPNKACLTTYSNKSTACVLNRQESRQTHHTIMERASLAFLTSQGLQSTEQFKHTVVLVCKKQSLNLSAISAPFRKCAHSLRNSSFVHAGDISSAWLTIYACAQILAKSFWCTPTHFWDCLPGCFVF